MASTSNGKTHRSNQVAPWRAFTLIEILVVVAIIAILAAILFPAFARARENARRASCQSNLKQIGLSFFQYSQDYDERLPQVMWAEAGTPSSPGNYSSVVGGPRRCYGNPFVKKTAPGAADTFTTSWVDEISTYLKSDQIFTCPSDRKPNALKAAAPADVVGALGVISYGMNGAMTGYKTGVNNFAADIGPFDTPPWGPTGKVPPGQSLAQISGVSNKILVAEIQKAFSIDYVGIELNPPPTDVYFVNYNPVETDDILDTSTDFGSSLIANNITNPAGYDAGGGRHFGGANVLFADGHVKWMAARTPGLTFRNRGTPSGIADPTGSGDLSKEAINLWCPYLDVT